MVDVGSDVEIVGVKKCRLTLGGDVLFDFDCRRGRLGTVVQVLVDGRARRLVVELVPPNEGCMTVALRYVRERSNGLGRG
jgi:hypothetical protein